MKGKEPKEKNHPIKEIVERLFPPYTPCYKNKERNIKILEVNGNADSNRVMSHDPSFSTTQF